MGESWGVDAMVVVGEGEHRQRKRESYRRRKLVCNRDTESNGIGS